MHRHPRENAVAPLGQYRHQHAQAAIANGHNQRRGDQPHRPVRGLHRRGIGAGQRIDRPFERERHRQRRDLGEQQQHHRPDHAHLEIGAIAGPDIRPQMHQRPEQGRLLNGIAGGRRFAGARSRISMSHRSSSPGQPAHRIARRARFFCRFSCCPSYRTFDSRLHPKGANSFAISGICGQNSPVLPYRQGLTALRCSATWRNMNKIKTVCVYCGSGPGTNPRFRRSSRSAGKGASPKTASAWSMAAARSG